MKELKSHPCVTRCKTNPILTMDDIPYAATQIFNAGICKYQGEYVMVFRNDVGAGPGAARIDYTDMGIARSEDGITWKADPKPWIRWETDEIQRAYDPRITEIEGRLYLCFAVDTNHGIRGGIAVTDDLDQWEVLSLSAPDNRNMVMFPEKIQGKFARLERPFPIYGRGAPEAFDLWYSDSPDCAYWGNNQLVLGSEEVEWCNCKIGPGAPPVRTEAGWLTIYHVVDRVEEELPAWHSGWHKRYTVGVMLLDLEEPWKILGRAKEPLLVPEEPYELEGFRGQVLFPGGLILEDDGQCKIYYGGADTVECLAFAEVDDLIGLCQ